MHIDSVLKEFMAIFAEAFLVQDLSTGWLNCDPGPLFKPESFRLPEWVSKLVLLDLILFITMVTNMTLCYLISHSANEVHACFKICVFGLECTLK